MSDASVNGPGEKGKQAKGATKATGSGKGRGWLIAILIVVALCAIGWFVLNGIEGWQVREIAKIEGVIASLKADYVPLRFMILSRGDDRLSVRVRLYDRDDRQIAVFEESYSGDELDFDFLVVRSASGDAWFSFPYRVFTDSIAAKSGTDLFRYYDDGGFPAVFASAGMGESEREAFKLLFRAVKAGEDPGRAFFGNAVHDVKERMLFETGVVYKIVCRAKGGIEITED